VQSDDEQDIHETGSDELLSADTLRLPENANPLVRLHAMRAWLIRRQKESNIAMGDAALTLQQLQHEETGAPHLRRSEREMLTQHIQRAQNSFKQAQEHLSAYEEAETILEDCVNHLTVNERLLVEYYLVLEEIVQTSIQEEQDEKYSPRVEALLDVQQHVERIGSPLDDD
jgi:hypothetical protein